MPALRDPQHERFALEFVEGCMGGKGKTAAYEDAYKAAGYAPSAPNARRLAQNPKVRRRIAELVEEAAEFANVRVRRLVVEIDRVGRANFADFWTQDANGRLRLKSIDELPRELTAAIQSLEYDDTGRPRLKLFDKNQANFTLLKHLGGIPEAPTGGTTVNILNALSVEDQAVLAAALQALAGGEATALAPAPSEPAEAGAVPEAV